MCRGADRGGRRERRNFDESDKIVQFGEIQGGKLRESKGVVRHEVT
jgi:hypothetical protein